MKTAKLLATGLICAVIASAQPSHAEWDSYDDSQSNPLRVAAYLLHPIGWLAE